MNNPQIIADRIRKVAKDRGLPVKYVLSEIGLGTSAVQHMGESFPKTNTICKIADYFGVSVDYLCGRTDTPDLQNDDDVKIFNVLKQLSPVSRAEILLLAKEKLDKQENTETV